MSVCLVLPLKSLREGKTRLAVALTNSERAALIEQLLAHTVEQAAQFPGLGRTLLVSACEEARARAQQYGIQVLDEPVPGLNHALQHARTTLYANGVGKMLIVPCDLPLLSAEDLRCLADASTLHSVAISPDRARLGTNGLCLPASAPFQFAFGPQSFELHRRMSERLRLSVTELDRPGLAFDIDTPADLAQLLALSSGINYIDPVMLGDPRSSSANPDNL
jgi:2-phospho-L-lactate guanylyltransferase